MRADVDGFCVFPSAFISNPSRLFPAWDFNTRHKRHKGVCRNSFASSSRDEWMMFSPFIFPSCCVFFSFFFSSVNFRWNFLCKTLNAPSSRFPSKHISLKLLLRIPKESPDHNSTMTQFLFIFLLVSSTIFYRLRLARFGYAT